MIKPLTSLRFFFALMVFAHHAYFVHISHHFVFYKKLQKHIFDEGYIGVSFFFILSGFILSLNYKSRLLTKKITYKEFWTARIARIYPLHLLTLLLIIPFFIDTLFQDTTVWIEKLLLNMFLLQSFVPDENIYNSFNFVSWSLSDEVFFYLLFPFIIICYSKYRKTIPLSLILFLFIPICIFLYTGELKAGLFYINPVFRIMDFMIGILLYDVFESKMFYNLFRSLKMATIIEIAAIVLFIAFFFFHDYIPQGYRYSCYYWLPMTIIIFTFAHQSGYLSAILSGKLLVSLGEVSFGFYLIHILTFRYCLYINSHLWLIENGFMLMAVVFIVTIAASYFSHYLIELPCNKYIKSKYKATRTKIAFNQ